MSHFMNKARLRAEEMLKRIDNEPDEDPRVKEHKRDRQEKLRRTVALTRLDEQLGSRRSQRLANWEPDSPRKRKVLDAAWEWVAEYATSKRRAGLVLYGPVGTGKDHLATGVCYELAHRYGTAVYVLNGQELFSQMREAIKRESEKQEMDSLCKIEVLLLSDPVPTIGELSNYQANVLYRIAEGRAQRSLPTIVTLNVKDDAEADARLGAATWDRLYDRAWKVHMDWESFRAPTRVV